MDEREARLILQAVRPGAEDSSDPRVAEALQIAARNPEISRWLEEERAFDRAIATHLENIQPPLGLKTRILAQAEDSAKPRSTRWAAALAVVAALLFLTAQIISLWRGVDSHRVTTTDFSSEMVSFIRLTPPLQMESNDLDAIRTWLGKRESPAPTVPAKLTALDPVGCRVLSFRGHDVTLICFHREGGRLAHLFVVDRAALPRMGTNNKPVFANENGWMTAVWSEGGRIYMLALQGGRAEAEQYLPRA